MKAARRFGPVLAVVVTTCAARLVEPSEGRIVVAGWTLPVLCPVRRLTGHRCPGCGMTRAVLLVLRGHIGEGARLHPLAPPLLAYVLLAARWGRPARRPALQTLPTFC